MTTIKSLLAISRVYLDLKYAIGHGVPLPVATNAGGELSEYWELSRVYQSEICVSEMYLSARFQLQAPLVVNYPSIENYCVCTYLKYAYLKCTSASCKHRWW